MFHPEIYRAYDIRGVVPEEFNKEEAYHLGRAYAQFTGFSRVVVARDMRVSGDDIEPAVIRGLRDAGVDVLQIGLATSPMFYYAVHTLKAEGGIMVTASHNPAKYNGAKMTREQAIPISGETGIMEIRDLVEKREWPQVGARGSLSEHKVTEAYIDMVTQGASAEGLKIVIDAGNGMTGHILAQVMQRLGGEVIPLYWELDGTFPNHEADPLNEQNNADVQAAIVQHGADLGVAFDGDGDRVFFFTEEGVTIPGDITTALIAGQVLKEQPGTPIIFDIRASRTTPEFILEAGGRPVMWKVGHSLIKPKMREEGAYFAGEVSGHFFFAPWYAESGMLAFNYFLRLVRERGQKVSEIVAPLMRRSKTPEINYEVADKEAVLALLKKVYAGADRIFDFDGIRFEFSDWWASVRPSNTEPKLRLNLEAETPQLLEEKRVEIEHIIQNASSSDSL